MRCLPDPGRHGLLLRWNLPVRALDLFCGAGGVSEGLRRAGFEVTGVDLLPQPHYRGGVFVQADALTFPLEGYDFIWASPPCQAYSSLRVTHPGCEHPDLIGRVRERLLVSGVPWAIENVPGAPLRNPVVLCGLALGLKVKRHRLIEASFPIPALPCPKGHPGEWYHVAGRGSGVRTNRNAKTPRREPPNAGVAREAMGISWMPWSRLSQAIPPAYSEHVGRAVPAKISPPPRKRLQENGNDRARV